MYLNIVYSIAALFIICFSTISQSNSISNCSTCGAGFGGNTGEIKPNDLFFNKAFVKLICPKKGKSFLQGFYNKNYIWV